MIHEHQNSHRLNLGVDPNTSVGAGEELRESRPCSDLGEGLTQGPTGLKCGEGAKDDRNLCTRQFTTERKRFALDLSRAK